MPPAHTQPLSTPPFHGRKPPPQEEAFPWRLALHPTPVCRHPQPAGCKPGLLSLSAGQRGRSRGLGLQRLPPHPLCGPVPAPNRPAALPAASEALAERRGRVWVSAVGGRGRARQEGHLARWSWATLWVCKSRSCELCSHSATHAQSEGPILTRHLQAKETLWPARLCP